MPHTSHKKKLVSRSKRRETVDEDGWTRVSSVKAAQEGPSSTQSFHEDEHQTPDLHTIELSGHNNYANLRIPSCPLAAADDMTDEKLLEHYQKINGRWKQSTSCKELEKTVASICLGGLSDITNCICFGTGSLSGLRDGWIGRHEVAIYQISAFRSVIDTIERISGKRPPAFAQEPSYNDYDVRLLAALSITTVDHPAGFEHIDSKSFTYCPGAEQFVMVGALTKDPAISLGSKLDLYCGKDGRMYAAGFNSKIYEDGHFIELDEAEKIGDTATQASVQRMREDDFQKSRVLEAYVRDKDMARLPELDAKEFPFHDQYLYWRSQT